MLVMLEFSTLQLKSGLQSEKSACRFAVLTGEQNETLTRQFSCPKTARQRCYSGLVSLHAIESGSVLSSDHDARSAF